MKDNKLILKNRKATYDYEIIETLEAGIALLGTEVKSIRAGRIDIKDAFARVMKNELYLMNAHISPYSHGNINNHDPLRDRKLLLNRNELNRLTGKTARTGLAIIPLSMYFKDGRVKVEIALAKGKKFYDRREDIKKKDIQREESRYNIKM
ncbi:MAG: SsrA-binding protein SmpB [bacterium]